MAWVITVEGFQVSFSEIRVVHAGGLLSSDANRRRVLRIEKKSTNAKLNGDSVA